MQVKWTLASDYPTFTVGLFDTEEEAEDFKRDSGISSLYPIPVIHNA